MNYKKSKIKKQIKSYKNKLKITKQLKTAKQTNRTKSKITKTN
jgi:hypothetical protein